MNTKFIVNFITSTGMLSIQEEFLEGVFKSITDLSPGVVGSRKKVSGLTN